MKKTCVAGLEIKDAEVNEEDQVMEVVDVTEPTAWSGIGLKMAEATTKAWKATYHVRSF